MNGRVVFQATKIKKDALSVSHSVQSVFQRITVEVIREYLIQTIFKAQGWSKTRIRLAIVLY